MSILDLSAKAVTICLVFCVNKRSVITVLLLAFECQVNFSEEEHPIFTPEGKSLSVWTAWQINRYIAGDCPQARADSQPTSLSTMANRRHRRKLKLFSMQGKHGRTDDSALQCRQCRDYEKSKHQIGAMWLLGEEARNKSLGDQTLLIWLFRKPFVLMPCAVLVMYYSSPMILHSYCIIWKKVKIVIVLRKITFPDKYEADK